MSKRLAAAVSIAVAMAATQAEPLVKSLGCRGNATEALHWQLHEAQKQAGVARFAFHDLRRTAAQQSYRRFGDVRVTQAILGHSSLGATLGYLNARRVRVTDEMVAPDARKDNHEL